MPTLPGTHARLSRLLHATFAGIAVLAACTAATPGHADSTAVPITAPANMPPSPSPVSLLPNFALIERWTTTQGTANTVYPAAWTPAAHAVAALCRFYSVPFDDARFIKAQLSPLEWPRVFADERVSARRQRADTEALLTAGGLAFRPVATLDFREAADTMLMALAAGLPVLLNTPDAQVVYGYDRREQDQWWWMQGGNGAEIVYESERNERYMFWDDDPAAGLLWVVTGPAPPPSPDDDARSADTELLETVSRSVSGDPESGIEPYPLSIRRIIDRLETTDTLPPLVSPFDAADPIGIHRALAARRRLAESVERLVPTAIDSAISEPLRLAQYYYHSSTAALEQAHDVFYGGARPDGRLAALRTFWSDPRRRAEAARLLQETLRWERDALGEINRALAARDQLESD